MEKEGVVPPEENKKIEALDEQWIERLEKIKLTNFNGEKEKRAIEKEKFLAGETENPDLDYPGVFKKDLDQVEQDLLRLKIDLIDSEPNEVIKELYRARINEDLIKVRMYQATRDGDMDKFRYYSELAYGRPSFEIYSYLLKKEIGTLWKDSRNDNPALARASKELYDLFTGFKTSPKVDTVRVPKKRIFQGGQNVVRRAYGEIINIPESFQFDLELRDAQEIKREFEEVLSKMQEKTRIDGWKVLVEKDRQLIGVLSKGKKIKIPEDRTMSQQELVQKDIHELLTHILRNMMGERTTIKLLRIGTAKYEKYEEGLATAREQALEKEMHDFAKPDRYLAASLAYGLDGQPRDFRGVFEVMEKYYLHQILKKDGDKKAEEATQEAREKSWDICVRIFRGTDCKTPGVCWTKDIIYREGNIMAWDLIRQDPEEIQRYNLGKINPDELILIKQQGIDDKTFEEIMNQ